MKKGIMITQGKTKEVWAVEEGEKAFVIIKNKKDITKHDDPKKTQQMESKDVYATATACAVFELLKQAGIPVAYDRRLSETEFIAPACKMIKLEVIARRYAVGSYLDRNPHLAKEKGVPPHRFHSLVFELFLKTTGRIITDKDGRKVNNIPLPIDDPFISNPYDKQWDLKDPKTPGWTKIAIDDATSMQGSISKDLILPDNVTVADIEKLTRKTFLVLEGAWAQLGCRLIDFKIEFGVGSDGKLMVADVIDNDSWRLRTSDWKELSKQNFRDNLGMEEIASKYALVAKMVERFRIPQQALIIWSGSEDDPTPPIPDIAGVYKVLIAISGHKKPRKGLDKLEEVLAAYPEGCVILSNIGRSNGLGPTLAARTSVPVIAIPVTALTRKEKTAERGFEIINEARPHDVWSSLEMPSQVPLATVLYPNNAVLMALNILAMKNPAAYMARQYAIELLDD